MYLKKLIQSGKTIFSLDDLGKIWGIENRNYLKLISSRLFKRGEILRISRGLYAINDAYNILEFANKLKVPSYVSLETVLQKEGIIFQDYSKTVFSVSNNSVLKKNGDKTFKYFKIKDVIFSNPSGIDRSGQVNIAVPERALCDRIYLSPNYYFDNLRPLNKEKLLNISKIYNKRVQKEVALLINKIKEG
jgi:predicted transcriptional regulator of viral defense system